MKTKTKLLLGALLSLLVLPLTTTAATSPCATTPVTTVYDLKTDWSDTQNPNGAWSYRLGSDGNLLGRDPFPWMSYDNAEFSQVGLARVTEALVVPERLEPGDIFVVPSDLLSGGVTIRWTAPANGTITVSGNLWASSTHGWTLKHKGNALSGAAGAGGTRTAPYDFASASPDGSALQNIAVQAGDHVELVVWLVLFFWDGPDGEAVPAGLNLTITHTIDSNASFAEDPIIWHQPLARNGASEDTDPSAGGTVKYRFKRGSTIPIQIHALGCDGADVISNSNVIGHVTVFGDSNCEGATDANTQPIDFSGFGGSGGVMDKVAGHLRYNLDTQSLPTTTQCYILHVTVKDTITGEEMFEEVLLEAK